MDESAVPSGEGVGPGSSAEGAEGPARPADSADAAASAGGRDRRPALPLPQRLPFPTRLSLLPLFVALPVAAGAAAVLAALVFARGPASRDVTIRSDPPAASVFVDGEFRGVTPLSLEGMTGAGHALRLEKSGFETHFGSVGGAGARGPGAGADGAITMRRLPAGRLEVNSKPKGADVFLDGEFRGTTPLGLDGVRPGPHALRLEKTNHLPRTASVLVKAGEAVRYRFDLVNRVLEFLKRAAAEFPDEPLRFMELGHYHMLLEEPEEAAEAYVRATVLARRPSTNKDDRRKVEMQLRRDRQMRSLGSRMGVEFDRLMRERSDSDAPPKGGAP